MVITMDGSFVLIDGKRVDMGDDGVQVSKEVCPHHGGTYFLTDDNEGGFNGMSICLECCVEIHKYLTSAPHIAATMAANCDDSRVVGIADAMAKREGDRLIRAANEHADRDRLEDMRAMFAAAVLPKLIQAPKAPGETDAQLTARIARGAAEWADIMMEAIKK